MSDAREVIGRESMARNQMSRDEIADRTLAALSAMPIASRLALARALVPEMAVVSTKASVSMVGAGVIAALAARETKPDGMSELGSDLISAFPAMLAAAEKETPDERT